MTQFFFYDLETSGLDARNDRIMQFAGIRTDMDLNQIGDPVNILVKMNDDTLPSPEALMVTGISPQKTIEEGYSEAEFCRIITEEIFTPDTIVVGFNNVRFDDEFIRHILWRNFHDPYEWAWCDGRSRWDLLDVVRMTRALRPEGIEWPVDKDGEPTNRLELITASNGIDHYAAHDALSDVIALIDVTRLIKDKQPKLYEYLLNIRNKNEIKKIANLEDKKPFVYTSGRYDKEFQKTTVAFPLTTSKNGNIAVYDLRYDPTPLINLSSKELAEKMYATWEEKQSPDFIKLPVKELKFNHCPAVAPLGVLEQSDGWKKISLDIDTIEKHRKILLEAPHFAENIRSIYEDSPEFKKSSDPEAQLYDGFLNNADKRRIEDVRKAKKDELVDYHPDFQDERLSKLLLHYKARNYPDVLSESETEEWEKWRAERIKTMIPGFMESLTKAMQNASEKDQYIIQELQLWAESIMPYGS